LYLVQDSGSGLYGPIDLSASETQSVSNGQCTIYNSYSDVELRDDYLDAQNVDHFRQIELSLYVSFKPAFAGDLLVYLGSQGSDGNAAWQPSGVWRVPGATGPVFGVSESVATTTQTVTVGNITPSNLTNIWDLINTSLNGENACYVAFNPVTGQAYLMDNAGDGAWLPTPVTVANGSTQGSGSVSNSQCTLYGSGSSYQQTSSQATLTLQFGWLGGFATSPTVAYVGAAISGVGTGWFSENVLGEPVPPVTVNFPQLSGPVRVEANLGPFSVDLYGFGTPNCMSSPACQTDRSQRWVPACDYSLSVRQCYINALSGYGLQQVSGVRFQFALCGGASSTALAHCENGTGATWSSNSQWTQNLSAFFSDIYAAGIQNITPTPSLAGFGGDAGVLTQTLFDNCINADTTITFWPASPFGIGADPNDQFSLNNPADTPHNGAYNCSPATPNFVGWDNILAVYEYVLQAAQANHLTVEEFDMTNETALDRFTVEGRVIVDNTNPWTDPSTGIPYSYTPVLNLVQALMAQYGFAQNGASGATVSTFVSEARAASADCKSYYEDSARLFGISSLVGALHGDVFGAQQITFDPSHGVLQCGALPPPDAVMLPAPPGFAALPNVLDQHDGAFVVGAGPYQSQGTVATEAQTTFTDVKTFMSSFCVGGPRNPTGPNPLAFCNALYMLGETDLYTPFNPLRYRVNCTEGPLATPAGTVQGYNASTLWGRRLPNGAAGTVWRPWLDPISVSGPTTVLCFTFPENLSQWYTPIP